METTPTRVLVDINLRGWEREHVGALWRLVILFALEVEGATTFVLEGALDNDPPDQVLKAWGKLTKRTGGHPDSEASPGWIHPDLVDALANIGPWVTNLQLMDTHGWVAGISDWGQGAALVTSAEDWGALRETWSRLLPRPLDFDEEEIDQ